MSGGQPLVTDNCFHQTLQNISFNCTKNGSIYTNLKVNNFSFSCERVRDDASLIWDSPILVLLRIEILVIIATTLFAVLVLFGSCRRRSSNSFLNLILFMAYTIPNLLVPYAIGLMGSVVFKNSLFVIWAMFLILVLRSSSSMSAYTLDDNEQWKSRKITLLVQLFWACWLLLSYASDLKVSLPLAIILVLSGFKMADTCEAFRLATLSHGVATNTKLVADFMDHEYDSDHSSGGYDPVTMRGYNYLVAGDDQDKVAEVSPPDYRMKLDITNIRVITIYKIWDCKGKLLNSLGDPHNRMKDMCLSFALYKLLRRRFAGYQLAEAGKPKTLDFVLHGILSMVNGEERAFRVIEVELAFLYDSFYTTYPVIFARWFKMLAMSCLMLLVDLWILAMLPKYNFDRNRRWKEEHTIFDVYVTFALMISMLSLELLQIMVCVLSNWTKVLVICKYVQNPSLQGNPFLEKIFGFLCWPRRILSPWNRKLGQYSLVDLYDYCPCKLLLCMQWLFLVEKTRKGQKTLPQIKLSKAVKKAIADSLQKTDVGRLSNGLSPPVLTGASDSISWAFNLQTKTHSILVWHIATTLCEKERAKQTPKASDDSGHFLVASSLSRYCAYLVAFVPELLPDHKYFTSCVFNNVVKEANRDLAGSRDLRGSSENTIMSNGWKLSTQLMSEMQGDQLWEALKEFWADMMLYLAPSDNAKAHAERLAKGGEFITHLWALLSHAGILQRDEASRVRRESLA